MPCFGVFDNLIISRDDVCELMTNWDITLCALSDNRLHLSPSKITIAPKQVIVLGRISWEGGILTASPHI